MHPIPWLKLHTEARNDAKLRSLDDRTHRVWFNLLCYAADQKTRGVIAGHKEKLLAIEVAAGDVQLLRDTLAELVELEIVTVEGEEIAFINFAKRNRKPSDEPDAVAQRKRDQRERESMSRDVTPRHDMSRHERKREKRGREDQEGEGVAHGRDGGPPAPEEGSAPSPSENAVIEAEPVDAEPSSADAVAKKRRPPRSMAHIEAGPWRFTAEHLAVLEEAADSAPCSPRDLPGRIGSLIAKRVSLGKSGEHAFDAWYGLDEAQVVAWCAEAMKRARLGTADRSGWLSYAAAIVADKLELGVDLTEKVVPLASRAEGAPRGGRPMNNQERTMDVLRRAAEKEQARLAGGGS